MFEGNSSEVIAPKQKRKARNSIQMYEINQQKESLEGKIIHLTEENRQQNQEVEDLKQKFKELTQLQERMVPIEYLEEIKQEVQVKSNELQTSNEKLAIENEMLKKTLEGKLYFFGLHLYSVCL